MLNDREKSKLKEAIFHFETLRKFKKKEIIINIFISILILFMFIFSGSFYIISEGFFTYIYLIYTVLFFLLTTFEFLHILDDLRFKYFCPNYLIWMSADEVIAGMAFEIVTKTAIMKLQKRAIEEGVVND